MFKEAKDLRLIRHAQTKANVDGIVYTREVDLDLTPAGVEEAEILADHLLSLKAKPQLIYASPLLRAQRTAHIIQAKIGGEIITQKELTELNFGGYQGGDRAVMREIEFGYNSEKIKEVGGETIADLELRISEALKQIANSEAKSSFVVSHGLTLSVMTQMLLSIDRTFGNIKALKNADYNYFLLNINEQGGLLVEDSKLNCLRGPLNF